VKVQNQATLDGSPVALSVIKFMEGEDEYTGTSSELHSKLEGVAESLGVSVVRDKAWPKSARWLWQRIKEVLPLLVAAGIDAKRERPDTGTIITLRKVPRNDASNASAGEPRPDNEKATGNRAALVPSLMPEMGLMPVLMPARIPLLKRHLATLAALATEMGILAK